MLGGSVGIPGAPGMPLANQRLQVPGQRNRSYTSAKGQFFNGSAQETLHGGGGGGP